MVLINQLYNFVLKLHKYLTGKYRPCYRFIIISYIFLGKTINWVEAATGGFFADNLYIVILIGVKLEMTGKKRKDFGHVSSCACDGCTNVSIFLIILFEKWY